MMRPAVSCAIACAVALMALASAAGAESAYGCRGLPDSDILPALEGEQGQMFRIDPDLHMYHWIEDRTLFDLRRLSDTLAAHGTRLIYVPLPTRALAMPEQVPPSAADMGFDPDVAISVWQELHRALSVHGIAAVDIRPALRRASNAGRAPFFAADTRLSEDGVAVLAAELRDAVAPALPDAPRAIWHLSEEAPRALPSLMRLQLQQSCVALLPEPAATPLRAGRDDTGDRIAAWRPGTDAVRPSVALVGDAVALDPALSLAERLAAETGLRTEPHTVPGGDAFAAIAGYLAAPGFRDRRPPVLVWLDPVWLPLGGRADLPTAGLIAAASDRCTVPVPLIRDPDSPERLSADLADIAADPDAALQFQPDTRAARTVRFGFVRGEAFRTRRAARVEGGDPDAPVFVPLSALWAEGADRVEIALDAAAGDDARLMYCPKE